MFLGNGVMFVKCKWNIFKGFMLSLLGLRDICSLGFGLVSYFRSVSVSGFGCRSGEMVI